MFHERKFPPRFLRSVYFCREWMFEKKPSSWWPSWKTKSGYGRRGSTPSKPKRRWPRPPVVRREASVFHKTTLSSRLYCCTFIFTPASSAPSAPSLGGSLSAGSHSGGGDPDQAWPQSSGEEDLQLQLALAMSKEEAEQVPPSSRHTGSVTSPLSKPRSERDRFATCRSSCVLTPTRHTFTPRTTPTVAVSPCNAWPPPERLGRSGGCRHPLCSDTQQRDTTKGQGAECVPGPLSSQSSVCLSVCWRASGTDQPISQSQVPVLSCPVPADTFVSAYRNDFNRSIFFVQILIIFAPRIYKIHTNRVGSSQSLFKSTLTFITDA